MQLLAFRRQGNRFALPVSCVKELTAVDDILPSDSGNRLKGICRIDGRVLPVLDPVRHSSVVLWESTAQLIVVSFRSQWIGLVYDQIIEVCPVAPSRIASAEIVAEGDWPQVKLNHGQASYLDPECLVQWPELAALDSLTGAIAYDLVG